MTTFSLPLYAAVALAGIGFVFREAAVRHIPQLRARYVPEPLIGGLAIALFLVAIPAFGWSVEVPDRGFARVAGPYYAVVIATAFLAVTTGWGPIAMWFLRRFTDQSGPVEPMPMILPLNAFFLFPWMAILLTRLVFAVAKP